MEVCFVFFFEGPAVRGGFPRPMRCFPAGVGAFLSWMSRFIAAVNYRPDVLTSPKREAVTSSNEEGVDDDGYKGAMLKNFFACLNPPITNEFHPIYQFGLDQEILNRQFAERECKPAMSFLVLLCTPAPLPQQTRPASSFRLASVICRLSLNDAGTLARIPWKGMTFYHSIKRPGCARPSQMRQWNKVTLGCQVAFGTCTNRLFIFSCRTDR